MSGIKFLLTLFGMIFYTLSVIDGLEYELTFVIGPGVMECFYQPIESQNNILEIDYQVLEGSSDIDINFYLKDPANKYLRTDQRKRSATHEISVTQTGTYELCFDNRYSRLTEKMIFFDIYSEGEDRSFVGADRTAQEMAASNSALSAAAELIDITVEQFTESINSVQKNIERTKSVQAYLRANTKSDRTIQEANFTRVNTFSGLYMFAMVTVSIIQVMMIRNLFTAPVKGGPSMKVAT